MKNVKKEITLEDIKNENTRIKSKISQLTGRFEVMQQNMNSVLHKLMNLGQTENNFIKEADELRKMQDEIKEYRIIK